MKPIVLAYLEERPRCLRWWPIIAVSNLEKDVFDG